MSDENIVRFPPDRRGNHPLGNVVAHTDGRFEFWSSSGVVGYFKLRGNGIVLLAFMSDYTGDKGVKNITNFLKRLKRHYPVIYCLGPIFNTATQDALERLDFKPTREVVPPHGKFETIYVWRANEN